MRPSAASGGSVGASRRNHRLPLGSESKGACVVEPACVASVAMRDSNTWNTYKRGAVVLVPLALVALQITSRACRHISANEVAHGDQIRARIHKDMQRSAEERIEEVNAKARAERLPPSHPQWGTPIATGQSAPSALVVDKTHVYWLNVGKREVVKAPRAAGPLSVLASKQTLVDKPHARTLAIDGEAVYWLTEGNTKGDKGAIMRVPKAGGEPKAIVDAQMGLNSIAIRDGYVFWISGPSLNHESDAEPRPGSLFRMKLPEGRTENLSTAADPCGLSLDGTHVYWVDTDARTLSINRTPRGGGDTETIVRSTSRLACNIVVDKTHVYWIDKSNDTLMRATKSGEGQTKLAVLRRSLSSLAIRPASVIAVTDRLPASIDGSGGIFQVPKAGQKLPERLNDNQIGVNDLVVEGDELFWTRWSESEGDGSVMRVTLTANP